MTIAVCDYSQILSIDLIEHGEDVGFVLFPYIVKLDALLYLQILKEAEYLIDVNNVESFIGCVVERVRRYLIA